MKSKPNALQPATTPPAHAVIRAALASAALLFGACSAMIAHPKPTASWTQRSGQVKFSSGDTKIVGDIVIRHDKENFLAQISKGPGLPMLTLSAKFGTDPTMKALPEKHMLIVRATGPLSHGGWTWDPASLAKEKTLFRPKMKDSSRAWAALPEVFEWAEAHGRGEDFRVCFPDITFHGNAGKDGARSFDYKRHENPTGNVLPLADLRKLPAIETVVCHLDK